MLNLFARVEGEFIMSFKNYMNPWKLIIEYQNLGMDVIEEVFREYEQQYSNRPNRLNVAKLRILHGEEENNVMNWKSIGRLVQ